MSPTGTDIRNKFNVFFQYITNPNPISPTLLSIFNNIAPT